MWDWAIIATWILNWIIMVIFWVALIILIVWAVTKLVRTGKSVRSSSAPDIDGGNIPRNEFEQIRKDIQ